MLHVGVSSGLYDVQSVEALEIASPSSNRTARIFRTLILVALPRPNGTSHECDFYDQNKDRSVHPSSVKMERQFRRRRPYS